MKISDFEKHIDITRWKFLSEGAYNLIFISDKPYEIEGYTSHWVLKQPKRHSQTNDLSISDKLSLPERALRKWRLINPNLPAWQVQQGWIAPYIQSSHPQYNARKDIKIAHKVIKIYQATKNIVVDTCGMDNFIISGDHVICIDVDLALQQDSDTSRTAFRQIVNTPTFNNYFMISGQQNGTYITAKTIQVLLYLDREACDFQLRQEYIIPNMIEKLDTFYQEKAVLTANKLDILWQIIQFDPNHEISNSDITPELIMHLEMKQEQGIPLTKEIVLQLIQYEHDERKQRKKNEISHVFSSLCDLLPTDDAALLDACNKNNLTLASRFSFFRQSSQQANPAPYIDLNTIQI